MRAGFAGFRPAVPAGSGSRSSFSTTPAPPKAIRPERETRLNSKRGWPAASRVGPLNGSHSLTPGHMLTRALPYIKYPLSVKRYFDLGRCRHGPPAGSSAGPRNRRSRPRDRPAAPGSAGEPNIRLILAKGAHPERPESPPAFSTRNDGKDMCCFCNTPTRSRPRGHIRLS